jgi:hypothetical protein
MPMRALRVSILLLISATVEDVAVTEDLSESGYMSGHFAEKPAKRL